MSWGRWYGTYEGFETLTGIRYDFDDNVNFTGQWLPYRGGVMIGYSF